MPFTGHGAKAPGWNESTEEMVPVGRIAVHEFITLDGVISDPAWSFDYSFHPKMIQAINEIMGSSKAILMGRNTYDGFAPTWATRTVEDDPGAPFMNETPKYVVSTTLQTAEWNNSTVLGPYSADTIRELKNQVDGNIYVSGSGTLVRALIADGLADELHLFVYPLTLGSGQRLFPDGVPGARFNLARSEAYDTGVVYLTYQPAAPASGH